MTREELLEKRRKVFEETHNMKSPAMLPNGVYRNTYAQAAWITWNAALDSVEIELPTVTVSMVITSQECKAIRCGIDMCRSEIEDQGYKVKP